MKDAQTSEIATGTSLEVLAPYLPYGIEIETGIGPCRILNVGLAMGQYPLEVCTTSEFEDGEWSRSYYGFEDVLPILRDFRDLCTPLADGSIPAVAIAKLMWETKGVYAAWNCTHTEARVYNEHGGLLVYLSERFYQQSLTINAFELLRRCHFALPVNGRPLVEGSDYIRKSPAATSTKEGPSHE